MKKTGTKKLCVIAMLLAVTVVLSYLSGYLRIGTAIKLSVSFVSVYLTAALYGPMAGAFVGAMADIISCLVNPVGALIWQLSLIELCYGFMYGLFFYRRKNGSGIKNVYGKVALCAVLRFAADMFLKTKILADVGYVPNDFLYAVWIRLPGCLAMLILTAVAITVLEKKYTDKFCGMINK